jgi:hypothetical protein
VRELDGTRVVDVTLAKASDLESGT